jgi:4-amino-4-deoxy-L-arabinose transferase-like glycosyltransferase
MTVTLATFLFSATMAALLWSRRRDLIDLGLVFVTGLLIGVSTYVRSEAVLLLPAGVIWLALHGRHRRRFLTGCLLMCIVAIATFSPWTVRNYLQLDAFIPTSTSPGDNIYMGHSDCANGTWVPGCSLNRRAAPGREVKTEL